MLLRQAIETPWSNRNDRNNAPRARRTRTVGLTHDAPGPTPSSSSRWTGTRIDASVPASGPSSPTCLNVVVELGAGAGASMRYLAPGSQPHRHRTEPPYARRTAPQCRARTGSTSRSARSVPSRPASPSASVDAVICTLVLCTVERPDRCARGSAPHPASWRTVRVHRTRGVRARSGPSGAAAAPSPVAISLRRLLPRPRHRGRRSPPPDSPTCGSSHSGSVACSCPCGPRSVASQSHERRTTDGVGRHGRAHPGRDAFGVDPCDRRGRSRSCRAAATTSASSTVPASTGSSARPTNSRPNPRCERSWRCICCPSAIRCSWPVSSPRCPSDTPADSHSASVSAARTRTSSRSAVSIHVPGDAAWTNP